MIANCSHDEHWKYAGGQAGDQGGEWKVQPWYSRPWTHVIRHPDIIVGKELAYLARAAAINENCGYDQGTAGNSSDRYSFWKRLKETGDYDPAKIKVPCESDCSQSTASLIKAAGYRLGRNKLTKMSIYAYSGDLRIRAQSLGFEILTDEKYLESDEYDLPGDILLNEGHHVCINLNYGSKILIDWSEEDMTELKKDVTPKGTPEIYTFQRITASLGYYTDKIDGSYGKNSRKACIAFQKAHGLTQNGVCNMRTWKELLTNTTTY